MEYDVLIVGGGIAGLTSASYLSKYGCRVLLCEKEKKLGGLVNSFDFKGYVFDGGIRAIENSGIVMPMLRQLGLDIDFIKNNVSIGIENDVIKLSSKESLLDYQNLLNKKFPESTEDIEKIINEIKRVMQYMDILYGIDNPLFLDLLQDKKYLFKTLMPWLFKFLFTIKKIEKLNAAINEYLKNLTKNQSLIDMISQHFFKKTPAFFALSYFSLYLDYQYPKGGTRMLPDAMERLILSNNGEIKRNTQISSIDMETKQAEDLGGNKYSFNKLIWAADLKSLYNAVNLDSIKNEKIKHETEEMKKILSDKNGGDSVLTVYVTVDMDKKYFENICTEHFFYTPFKKGLSDTSINELLVKKSDNSGIKYTEDKETIKNWLKRHYEMTTYEISCPVIRDKSLAPEGKTGLIISVLMEHSLVKHISEMGWYEEYNKISEDYILNVLNETIFPGIKSKVIDRFTSTPLTLEKLTGNSEGAITGWAFTNQFMPIKNKMTEVAGSVLTPLPDVIQAGQWTFSPSGLPISILTGKLAADKIKKLLKK